MVETNSAQFIVAISFTISAILLIVISFAIHILIANKHLNLAQKKLKTMTANLSAAEERERKRIAEDLHDCIGETLVVSNHSLQELKKKWSSEEASQDLDELSGTIGKLMKGARSLIFDLIPPALYDIGLEAALESFVAKYKQQYRIDVKFETDGKPKPLETDVAVFLYKAVREFILNTVKHAGADCVTIKLCNIQKKCQVIVEDNGKGFEPEYAKKYQTSNSGYGLFNIQIQAEHYGGNFEIGSSPSGGGQVKLVVPLQKENPDAN